MEFNTPDGRIIEMPAENSDQFSLRDVPLHRNTLGGFRLTPRLSEQLLELA